MYLKKNLVNCLLRVYSEQKISEEKISIYYRKTVRDDWQKLDTTYNKNIQAYHFSMNTDGVYFFKVTCDECEDEEKKINMRVGKTNNLIFRLCKKGKNFIQIGNQKLFAKLEGADKIGICIRPNRFKKDRKKVYGELNALGFKRIGLQPGIDNMIKYEFLRGSIDRSVEDQLKQICSKYNSIELFGLVLNDKDGKTVLVTDKITIKFDLKASQSEIDKILQKHNLEIVKRSVYGVNVFTVKSKSLCISKLFKYSKTKQDEDVVEKIDLDVIYTVELCSIQPNDALFQAQWDYLISNTPGAWWKLKNNISEDNTFGDPTIRIAIVDTGIDVDHPEFSGNLSNGAPKVGTTFDFSEISPDLSASDHSHGTSCASAATGTTNTGEGIAGIAGNCQLLPIRMSSNSRRQAEMFTWLGGFDPKNTEITEISMPREDGSEAHVISNSWRDFSDNINIDLESAFELITNFGRHGRGILLFFAVGNWGILTPSQVSSPFIKNERVIGVGASSLYESGRLEKKTDYSLYDPDIELCAPSGFGDYHNPPEIYRVFAATNSPFSLIQRYSSTISEETASRTDDNVLVLSDDLPGFGGFFDFARGYILLIGSPETSFFRAVKIDRADSHSPNIAYMSEPVPIPPAGTPVVMFSANTPGHFTNTTELTEKGFEGDKSIVVSDPTDFIPGNAVFIGLPGESGAESHAISYTEGTTVHLITNLKNNHFVGKTVNVGPAEYRDNFSGTSYATPICAGVAALILSANPDLTWVEIRQILRDTARKIDVGTIIHPLGSSSFQ